MIYPILVVELMLLYELWRRIPIINPAGLSCLFIVASQIAYVNGTNLDFATNPWATYSFETHPNPALLLYGFTFLLIYLSMTGIRQRRRTYVTQQIRNAAQVALRYQLPALPIVYAMTILGILLIKPDVLWHNNLYLLLGSSDSLRIKSALGTFLVKLCNYSGFVSIFFMSAAIAFRRWPSALLWLPSALWIIVLSLSEASRFSMIGIASIFIMLWILSDYSRVLLVTVFGSLSLIALLAALGARTEGSFGLSALPFIISRAFYGRSTISQLILNVFQGIFITGDGLDFQAQFPLAYKLLSFSPFPSFIDHFDKIRDLDQIRLFYYIPMSALTESVAFGIGWYLLLISAYCIAFRLAINRANELGGFYLFVVVTGFASFVLSGAYPVRNVYRQVLINIALTLLVSWWNRYRRRRTSPPRTTRAAILARS